MAERSSTVRISNSSKETLEEIAQITGASQVEVLGEAIEEYRRTVMLKEIAASFARLSEEEREDYIKEFEEWDVALPDGLEDW